MCPLLWLKTLAVWRATSVLDLLARAASTFGGSRWEAHFAVPLFELCRLRAAQRPIEGQVPGSRCFFYFLFVVTSTSSFCTSAYLLLISLTLVFTRRRDALSQPFSFPPRCVLCVLSHCAALFNNCKIPLPSFQMNIDNLRFV